MMALSSTNGLAMQFLKSNNFSIPLYKNTGEFFSSFCTKSARRPQSMRPEFLSRVMFNKFLTVNLCILSIAFFPKMAYNIITERKKGKVKKMNEYEQRYWELRKEVERAESAMLAHEVGSLANYNAALSNYQDFCMDVLEQLMDKDEEILKNLR